MDLSTFKTKIGKTGVSHVDVLFIQSINLKMDQTNTTLVSPFSPKLRHVPFQYEGQGDDFSPGCAKCVPFQTD